ncbi:MAG TPA: hypothetical protein VF681_14300 [Abditibacteriaceae bacterium]|jgi:hypothetical protein
MTHKTLLRGLNAALLGIALAGCGNNAVTAPTNTATSTGAATVTEGAVEPAPAELAAFFPGATLAKKAFPMNNSAIAHMSEESGVKFNGKEGEWEVYEASQNGQRVGLAVMTHSDLPSGRDMHVAFAVDKDFKVSKIAATEAPDAAKMKTFVAQMVGKTHDAGFKVGKELKTTAGLSPQDAQIAADAVHKGLYILEENFNPAHAEEEAKHAAKDKEKGHTEGDGHSH